MLTRNRSIGRLLLLLLSIWLCACQPGPERLAADAERAAELGWDRLVERFAIPSLEAIEKGGWVALRDSQNDVCQVCGPNMYVESQAYDLNWFMDGHLNHFHRPQDEAVARRIVQVLLKTQHPQSGNWPWSDDGCLHEYLAVALHRMGQPEAALKAVDWAAEWGLKERLTPEGHLMETEGIHVVKSFGLKDHPPLPFDGGYPHVTGFFQHLTAVDEYPMLLEMLAITGTRNRHPEFTRRLELGWKHYLDHPKMDRRNSVDFIQSVGIAIYLLAIAEGRLEADPQMTPQAQKLLLHLAEHQVSKLIPETLITATLLVGVAGTELIRQHPDLADELALHVLNAQDIGGEWPMNKFLFLTPATDTLIHDFRVTYPAGEVECLSTYYSAFGLRLYADNRLR